MLLDPNTLSKDGTVALAGAARSATTASYVAYGVADAGSDWDDLAASSTSHRQDADRRARSGSSSPAPPGRTTARASSTAATPSRPKDAALTGR